MALLSIIPQHYRDTVSNASERLFYFLLALFFKCVSLTVQTYAAYTDTHRRTERNIHAELNNDFKYLSYVYGDLDKLASAESLTSADVADYYTNTTLRDYKLMEMYVGSSGMHTLLQQPKHVDIGALQQAAMVLSALNIYRSRQQSPPQNGDSAPATRPSVVDTQIRVLELGSGKGSNTHFVAANTSKHVECIGIDLTELHTQLAQSAAQSSNISNCTFYTADYTQLHNKQYVSEQTSIPVSALQPASFDIIYSIESLCYIHDKQQQKHVMQLVQTLLKPRGSLIIIDGFRSARYGQLSQQAQLSMRLAELGYRCTSMPTKSQWHQLAKQHNLNLTADIDLTNKAIPFWQEGRIGVRFLLHFWPFLTLLRSYVGQTANNFLAMATTAYAMETGAAEYGTLVFTQPNVTVNGTSKTNRL